MHIAGHSICQMLVCVCMCAGKRGGGGGGRDEYKYMSTSFQEETWLTFKGIGCENVNR